MKRWFRFQGIAAFIVILVVFSCFWFLFIDTIARKNMEKTATSLVGAEVNIRNVDLRFLPLGLTIEGVQVTDPENPQTNAVEIGRLSFSLDTMRLFLRKAIIEEMGVEGVALGTKRDRPGKVQSREKEERVPRTGKGWDFITLPSFSPADIQKILEKEDLKTLALIRSLQEETSTRSAFWEKRLGEIPDTARLEQYRVRMEKLKTVNKGDVQSMLSAGAEAKSLQEDLRKDLLLLNDTKTQFDRDFSSINERIAQVKEAPAEDIRHLTRKYGPTPEGIGNVSAVLFGSNIGVWIERALTWYERIKPLVARSTQEENGKKVTKPIRASGVDVHFMEYAPLPDFLIRKTLASITLDQGMVKGTLDNITPDQDVLGKPLTFAFSAGQLGDLKSIDIHGTFDHIDPLTGKDVLKAAVKGYRMPRVDLGSPALPLALQNAVADLDLTAEVLNEKITADISGSFSAARFSLQEGSEKSPAYAALSSAFSKVNNFNLKARLAGTAEDYTIEVRSDLDRVAKHAIETLVADLGTQFAQEVKKGVQEKIETPLNSLQAAAGSMSEIGRELSGRIDLADGLMKDSLFSPGKKGGLQLPF